MGKPRAYPVSLASGEPHLVRLSLFGFGLSELGIIDAEFTRALHLVRKIRNEFAHEVKDAKLDQPPHRDRIRELTKIVSDTELFVDVKERYFLEKSGLIADFFTTLTILTLRLETLFQKIKPLKANIAYPIVPSNYSGKKSK